MCKCAQQVTTAIDQRAPKDPPRLAILVSKPPSSKAKGLKALQTFLDQFINLWFSWSNLNPPCVINKRSRVEDVYYHHQLEVTKLFLLSPIFSMLK